MPFFFYQAKDSQGLVVSGEIEADSADSARRRLDAQGFTDIGVSSDRPKTGNRGGMQALAPGEGTEVVRHLAQAGNGYTPLADGLRAAAYESSSHRMSAALCHLASEIERGRPALEVLADPKFRIPAHVRGL